MTPRAYYNEWDKDAAAWLRELIAAGLIMAGDVDERSIVDVRPADVKGYTQHHWFAGIGGWPLALQLADWPDDRPVATASLPCQPFSNAGKRQGVKDERHLWPVFAELVRECGFATIFGEQVESAIRHGWLDGVFSSLEQLGYACAAGCLPAACVGAPHIRQRLFWVAQSAIGQCDTGAQVRRVFSGVSGNEQEPNHTDGSGGTLGGVGYAASERAINGGQAEPGSDQTDNGVSGAAGPWSDCVLLPCRDGIVRRACPRISPLAHGIPWNLANVLPRLQELVHDAKAALRIIREARRHRITALKGAGNSICVPLAAEFIMACKEILK